MLEKQIIWFGRSAKLACDGICTKAWGIVCRPAIYLNNQGKVVFVDSSGVSPKPDGLEWDNHVSIPDHLLGEAPIDPGTYEGFQGKIPKSLNKWCARQCERSNISDRNPKIRDFSDYVFNMPSIQRIVEANPRWREEFDAAVLAAQERVFNVPHQENP
jgi:hypothetical protein